MDLPIHHTGPEKVAMMHFTRTILISRLFIFKDSQTFVVDRASWWQGESACSSSTQNFRYSLLEAQGRPELSRIQDPIPMDSQYRTFHLENLHRQRYLYRRKSEDIDIVVSLFSFYFWFRESFRLVSDTFILCLIVESWWSRIGWWYLWTWIRYTIWTDGGDAWFGEENSFRGGESHYESSDKASSVSDSASDSDWLSFFLSLFYIYCFLSVLNMSLSYTNK